MTLLPSQTGKKHDYRNAVSHRLFFIFISFALLVVICLTASVVSAKPPFPTISLPGKSQGDHAVKVLAGKLPEVAAWYGSTPQEFASMLVQDNTAWIDAKGDCSLLKIFLNQWLKAGLLPLLKSYFHTTRHLYYIAARERNESFFWTLMAI